jgi:hypothetical protein
MPMTNQTDENDVPRVLVSICMTCLFAVSTLAQDPFQVAPDAYRLQFENDWVKVTRVHYRPKEKIPAHDHPKAGTVFVYLNDGGPVRFQHLGEEPYPLVRPATRAGGFRLARAVSEHHEVENLSELPNEFLRVELKTDPFDVEHFQGRFPPEPVEKSFQRITFENGQVRIVRIACAAREVCDVTGSPSFPSLLIALAPVKAIVLKRGGEPATVEMGLGQTQWLAPSQKASLENSGKATVQQLRIEFKTGPMKPGEGVAKDE